MTRITSLETFTDLEHPLFLWVRIHTDSGIVGLGETCAKPRAVERIIHDVFAEMLIGEDPTRIDELWHRMYAAINYHGSAGTESRALSAVDIALWDILGKITDQPVYVLLGGASRDAIPIYNTCGNYADILDRDAFLTDPAGLARDLLAGGITVMKIWPFDELAARHGGQHIAPDDLEAGVSRVAAIRDAVGKAMEIAIEGHGLWNLPSAVRIARALEPYDPLWLEDMIWPDAIDTLAELRRSTSIPIMASERLFGRFAFRALLEREAADMIMFDMVWTGGFSEARKIADMADAYLLPIAPHNCGGPVAHIANAHLAAHAHNLFLLETVRAFYLRSFGELATTNLVPVSGELPLPPGPGLGVELRGDYLSRPTVQREVSSSKRAIRSTYATGDPWLEEKF